MVLADVRRCIDMILTWALLPIRLSHCRVCPDQREKSVAKTMNSRDGAVVRGKNGNDFGGKPCCAVRKGRVGRCRSFIRVSL